MVEEQAGDMICETCNENLGRGSLGLYNVDVHTQTYGHTEFKMKLPS
jgi:hypothetical protein